MKQASERDLTKDQLLALRDYANWAGKDWKQNLSADWLRAGSDWPGSRYPLLQQVRNQLGPKWLDTFELREPRYLCVGHPTWGRGATLKEAFKALKRAGYTGRKSAVNFTHIPECVDGFTVSLEERWGALCWTMKDPAQPSIKWAKFEEMP